MNPLDGLTLSSIYTDEQITHNGYSLYKTGLTIEIIDCIVLCCSIIPEGNVTCLPMPTNRISRPENISL